MNLPAPLAGGSLPQLFGSVKVGERGQVVIPQEAREQMGLHAGDKLLALGGIPGMQGVVFVKSESFGRFLAEIAQKMSAREKLMKAASAEAGAEAATGAGAPAGARGGAARRTKRSTV
jgi:AbrB family looped-hinge helix DNA binding protein